MVLNMHYSIVWDWRFLPGQTQLIKHYPAFALGAACCLVYYTFDNMKWVPKTPRLRSFILKGLGAPTWWWTEGTLWVYKRERLYPPKHWNSFSSNNIPDDKEKSRKFKQYLPKKVRLRKLSWNCIHLITDQTNWGQTISYFFSSETPFPVLGKTTTLCGAPFSAKVIQLLMICLSVLDETVIR